MVGPEIEKRWPFENRHWPPLALFALLAILLFVGLGACPLLDPDEGRYVEIPREALASGDLVTPRLDGVLYFEKPPLHYWLTAGAIRLFGLDELAGRVASATLGFAGVILAFLLARDIAGRRAALVAATALGISPLWIALGRLASIDMTLTFFTTATLVSFWFAHRAERRWPRFTLWLAMFAAAAFATLAKGLVGIVIPGSVVFFYLLLTSQWRILLRVPWLAGIAIFAAIAVPWHVLVAQRNPSFLWFYFVHEHFLRYTTPEADRAAPLWLFPAVLALGLAPWTGLIPSALRGVPWRAWRVVRKERHDLLFLLVWAGFVVLFFSASKSKLIPYVLPAVPALAVLAALGAEKLRTSPKWTRLQRIELGIGVLFAGVFGVALLIAGLGLVDRLGLGGMITPTLLVAGGVVTVATAAALAAISLARHRGVGLALLCLATVTGVALAAAGLLWGREYSAKELAEHLRPKLLPGDLLYTYHCFPHSLTVYLDRTVGVADYTGELGFGVSQLSETERLTRFPNAQEFGAIWRAPRRVFVVIHSKLGSDLKRQGLEGAWPVWIGPAHHVYCNQAP